MITGASRGLGRAMAVAMAAAGADVALAARSKPDLEETAQQAERHGVRALVLPTDVTRYDEVDALVARTVDALGRLDILVNNAGAMWREPLATFPDEGWDAVIDLNLKSPFWLVQALLPALRRAGTADDPARIINIGRVYAYKRDGDGFARLDAEVRQRAGKPVGRFQGTYRGGFFRVGGGS